MNTTTQTAPKTMAAKFPGACRCGCGGPIAVGQRIEWSRDAGARLVGHSARTARPAVTEVALGVVRVSRESVYPTSPARTRTARRGTWTGCSCGSRTDDCGDLIPARNNCSSCEHDA
jgi:hypothetical protein